MGEDPVWRALRPAGGCDGEAAAQRPWAYVALPSPEHPALVARHEAPILRYVTDALISAPPGGGVARAALYTAARWLLRRPGVWTLATRLRPQCRAVVDASG